MSWDIVCILIFYSTYVLMIKRKLKNKKMTHLKEKLSFRSNERLNLKDSARRLGKGVAHALEWGPSIPPEKMEEAPQNRKTSPKVVRVYDADEVARSDHFLFGGDIQSVNVRGQRSRHDNDPTD
jgi:hypothetical protein